MNFYRALQSVVLPVALSALLLACSNEVEHEKFPGGMGRTTDMRNAQTTQAVLGGIDSLNNPLADGDKNAVSSAKRIAGLVKLPEGASYKAGMSFFISARPAAGGPPLAVKRLGRVSFPYRFELTENDRMMEGTDFAGDVLLAIRLDQDGDPLSRQEGDFAATANVSVGDVAIELELAPVKPDAY